MANVYKHAVSTCNFIRIIDHFATTCVSKHTVKINSSFDQFSSHIPILISKFTAKIPSVGAYSVNSPMGWAFALHALLADSGWIRSTPYGPTHLSEIISEQRI